MDVQITTDGSANLATVIIEGAPSDVFVSADQGNLDKVVDADLASADDATVFATNLLTIVVAEGNPLGINRSSRTSANPDIALSLCQEEVPCGKYSAQAFEVAGLPVPPAGEEDKVSGVLTKVMLGEADAGLVYVTDVLGAGGCRGRRLGRRSAWSWPPIRRSFPHRSRQPRGCRRFRCLLDR